MNAVAAPISPAAKAWGTFQARAAVAGHTAIKSGGGWITVSRWGRSMTFKSLAEAETWLDRIVSGGSPRE